MTNVLAKAGVCPHCGMPLDASARREPAAAPRARFVRYDLQALAAEAAQEKVHDASARVRVTQQDIRKLLEKRRRKQP